MPSTKQLKAIGFIQQDIREGRKPNKKQAMLKAGYNLTTANNPKILTESATFQQVLKTIDYGTQLKQVEDLGDTRLNKNGELALKAKDMLFKLGDLYPKAETKIVGIFNKIDQIKE